MNSVYEDDKVCILSCLHPAYSHKQEADVAATFDLYRIDCRDDYDRVQQDDWLSAPGGFK